MTEVLNMVVRAGLTGKVTSGRIEEKKKVMEKSIVGKENNYADSWR